MEMGETTLRVADYDGETIYVIVQRSKGGGLQAVQLNGEGLDKIYAAYLQHDLNKLISGSKVENPLSDA